MKNAAKNLARFLLILFICLLTAGRLECRPVLVELFTTKGNKDCKTAEEAILQLQAEYPPERLQILVHHLEDDLQIRESVFRSIRYKIRTFPTVVFNGISKVEGGRSSALFSTYRNNVENFIRLAELGDFSGWMRYSCGQLVSSVTMTVESTERQLEIVLVLTQNLSESVFNVVTFIDTMDFPPGGLVAPVKNIEVAGDVYELGAEAVWFVQDKDSFEVILSGSGNNRSPIVQDFTGDRLLNWKDVFYFASKWNGSDALMDLSASQIVDVKDLLLFLGSE